MDWLKEHPSEIPLPPRGFEAPKKRCLDVLGTLLARWLFQPFDMLRRLGFTAQQEAEVLSLSPDAALSDRQKGAGPGRL